MSPRFATLIRSAACWLATNAARTPVVTIDSQRHAGCCQNGAAQVNAPFSTIRS